MVWAALPAVATGGCVLILMARAGPPSAETEPPRPVADASVHERYAAARLRIATEDLDAARAVRARSSDVVSDNELQQLEVKCEIARLRLEMWSDPSFRRSPIDAMQMQVDQITDFVVDAVDSIDWAPAMQRR
jgi:hypothetical protein